MKGYFIDEQADIVSECFAVVYAPRKQRSRFPENVVEVYPTEAEALQHASETDKKYAAKLIGPCRSSEGFNIFYLVNWLNEQK